MFNPFEGSAEIVRIKVNDLGTRIEENEEFYIYEIIQSINEAEEIVGTIKVPKDTFIVDGELLYCLEDGVPETNYVKGDAYIRLKVVTEEFKKDENGNILPNTTEKHYKYINILVTDLLNIPLTVIKVEYKNDSDTANGVSNITLNEEISEDGRIRTYTLVIERTTFVKDVSINDENDIVDTPYAIAEIIENTENPEHQSFEIKKVELPTKLPDPESLVFLPDELSFDGSKKIEFEIIDGSGTSIETIATENSIKYKINSEVDTEITNEENVNEEYIFDIERAYNQDGSITIKAKKDVFENLVFYCNNNDTGFKYNPTKNKIIDIVSGENVEINYNINDNNEIVYTIKSLLNADLKEDIDDISENFISELILEKQEDNSFTLKKTKTNFNNFIIKSEDGDMIYEPGGDNKITIKGGENVDIKKDIENSDDKNNILIINSKTDVTIDEVPQNNKNLVIKNIKDVSEPDSYDKHFEVETLEMPSTLPNPESLTFKGINSKGDGGEISISYNGSNPVEYTIEGGGGTRVFSTVNSDTGEIKYTITSPAGITALEEAGDYVDSIRLFPISEEHTELRVSKEDFQDLIFYFNGIDTGFKYNPLENKFVDIVSGNNMEINCEISEDNGTLTYTFNSITKIDIIEERVDQPTAKYVVNVKKIDEDDGRVVLKKETAVFEKLMLTVKDESVDNGVVSQEKVLVTYQPSEETRLFLDEGINTTTNAEVINDEEMHFSVNALMAIDINENVNKDKNFVIKNIKEASDSDKYHKHFEVETLEVATLDDIPEIPTELPNEESLKYKILNKQNSTIGNIEYKGDALKTIGIKEGKNITFETVESTNDALTYTINAADSDTHYEGKNIISTTNNTLEEVGAITNGNLKLNYIEGYLGQEECKSSVPIIGEDGIQVVKNVNNNTIIVNAKEIQTQLENGIKNPKSHVFTDGKTSVVYNGSEQKQTVIKEGDNIYVGSESITNGGAYTINAKDTNYKIIVTAEDSPLNDISGAINNEELQMRLIEISQVWDETNQSFTEKEAVKKIIPLSGANRTQVYKNSGDSTIYIDTPEYNFGDGFEHSDNDVDLNFDVDGWTIDAGKISHYCTCSTAKDISIKDVYSNKPFTYENGSMIAVRFLEGNTGYVNINFNGKTVPVYQGNVQYKTDFHMNTVLWLMYYDNGLNNYWLLIGAPSVQEAKNVIASSSTGILEGGTITNGNVYLNHLNDYQVKSSHLIKGENGIEVTADGNEISITAPDVDVTSLDEGGITSLNYGATFTVDSVSSGNSSHEIIVEKKHFKLPDAPTSTGGGEHYIAKHVLSDSPTGTTPVGMLTGTSNNPIYLNLIDGTENTKHISSLAIYGSGSTNVSTDLYGDELIIGSFQQNYGIADEDNPGLIKDGGDISVDNEGNVTVNTADTLRGYVYLDGLMLDGKDFAENKNISSFAWCSVGSNETSKTITLKQPCSLYSGLTLKVGFTNDNTASNPHLYITNGGKSAPIYYNGSPTPTNLIKANHIYTLVYHNGAFHITNINDNTITQIQSKNHADNEAIVDFSKMEIGDTIAYQPIYKAFATTDTNSKTIIDITKEPATGTPFVTDIDLSLDTDNDIRTYTPNYSTLEAALPNAMGVSGEEIIDVIQEDGDNGKPNWKISHKITDKRYGENKTSSVTGTSQSSEFGGTVKIPDIYYDKFGHIINTNTAYIELPSIEQIPVRYGLEVKKDDNDGKYYIQHTNDVIGSTVGINSGSSSLKYGDNFNIPEFTYDNQGHITDTYVKTFELPPIPDYSEIPNTPIIPEQIEYTGKNGISIDNNNYTVGHTNSIAASTTVKNTSTSLSYDSTFKIPVITYDAQGHITNKSEQILTLPSIPDYSEIPNTPTIPEQIEYTGKNGISIDNETYVIEHTNKITSGRTVENTSTSLSHGDSFKIPVMEYDAQGHITNKSEQTLTLPSASKNLPLTIGDIRNDNYIDYDGSQSMSLEIEGGSGISVTSETTTSGVCFTIAQKNTEPVIKVLSDIGDITDSNYTISSEDDFGVKNIFNYNNLMICFENYSDKTPAYLYGSIIVPISVIKTLSNDTSIKIPIGSISGLNGDIKYYQYIEVIKDNESTILLKGWVSSISSNLNGDDSRRRFGNYSVYLY